MTHTIRRPLGRDDIHAFIDNELDVIEAASVAAAVYADSIIAAEVADYRFQNTGFKVLYGAIAEEPLPDAMQTLLRAFQPPLREAC